MPRKKPQKKPVKKKKILKKPVPKIEKEQEFASGFFDDARLFFSIEERNGKLGEKKTRIFLIKETIQNIRKHSFQEGLPLVTNFQALIERIDLQENYLKNFTKTLPAKLKNSPSMKKYIASHLRFLKFIRKLMIEKKEITEFFLKKEKEIH